MLKLSLVAMVTLLLPQVVEAAWAAPCAQCPSEGEVCIPNTGQYGHYQRIWRAWPGTPPLDRTFPDAIGREPVPTPIGQKQEPLPRMTVPKTGPGEYPGGGILPPEPELGTGVLPDMVPEVPAERDDSGILGLPPGTAPLLPPEDNGTPGVIEEPSGDESPAPMPLKTDEPALDDTSGVELLPPANYFSEAASRSFMAKPIAMGTDLPIIPAAAEEAAADTIDTDTIDTGTEILSRHAANNVEPVNVEPDLVEPENVEPEIIKANWASAMGPASPARGVGPALLSSSASSDSRPINESVEETDMERGSGENSGSERLAHKLERIAQTAPVQLDGYCPVTLIEKERWVSGDKKFRVVHEGHAYLLSGEKQRKDFLAKPSRYTPAFSGTDAVLRKEAGKPVQGKVDYCVTYGGRLYTFSSAATLEKFQEDPKPYAAASND